MCLFLGFGCSNPPDRTTVNGAFAMIETCIDRADRQCLFKALDRDSRWSICTTHKTLVEIRRIAEKSYPADKRDSAAGALQAESGATTPEAVFEIMCEKRRCLERVARGYGAIQSTRRMAPDRMEIITSRGSRFEMVEADGVWGIDLMSQELNDTKLRVIDRLKQVKENARQYDEQKLAREGAADVAPR